MPFMDGETDGKAKLTAAWRAAAARMIEAGYNPADIHETMISVGLSGTVKSRVSYTMLVGVAIVGVSALLLFSDLISTHPSAIWRTLSGSRNETSEQQEALGRERKDAEDLKRDLAAARSEIEALKAEGSRALAASGEVVRAAEARGVEQISQDQTAGPAPKPDPASIAATLSSTTPEQVLLARANSL